VYIAALPPQLALTSNESHTILKVNPEEYGLIYDLQTSNFLRSGVLNDSVIF